MAAGGRIGRGWNWSSAHLFGHLRTPADALWLVGSSGWTGDVQRTFERCGRCIWQAEWDDATKRATRERGLVAACRCQCRGNAGDRYSELLCRAKLKWEPLTIA